MDKIIEQVAREMERDYASQSMHGCGAIGRIAIGYYKKALEDAGFVVVPIEPTEDMIRAGWIDKEDVNPDDIYRAMLAAASTATP